jgi:hypothetical protein
MSEHQEHGPERCHRRNCRAEPCIADARAYQAAHKRHRTRMIAYGRWNPFVDAEPARQHVAALRAAGIGIDQIPALAGLDRRCITRLPRTRSLRAETAAKILAIQPHPDLVAGGARTDATGTRRRLQALQALGWSQRRLAELLDTQQVVVGKAARGKSQFVTVATARRVRDLYDHIWNQPPPSATRYERQSATNARRAAAERGWVPPLAWDDDTIDDPNAAPEGAEGSQPVDGRLPDRDDLQMLIETGSTVAALAQRFGVEESSVKAKLRRCGLKVAA